MVLLFPVPKSCCMRVTRIILWLLHICHSGSKHINPGLKQESWMPLGKRTIMCYSSSAWLHLSPRGLAPSPASICIGLKMFDGIQSDGEATWGPVEMVTSIGWTCSQFLHNSGLISMSACGSGPSGPLLSLQQREWIPFSWPRTI
jgi:hypothetical protein